MVTDLVSIFETTSKARRSQVHKTRSCKTYNCRSTVTAVEKSGKQSSHSCEIFTSNLLILPNLYQHNLSNCSKTFIFEDKKRIGVTTICNIWIADQNKNQTNSVENHRIIITGRIKSPSPSAPAGP